MVRTRSAPQLRHFLNNPPDSLTLAPLPPRGERRARRLPAAGAAGRHLTLAIPHCPQRLCLHGREGCASSAVNYSNRTLDYYRAACISFLQLRRLLIVWASERFSLLKRKIAVRECDPGALIDSIAIFTHALRRKISVEFAYGQTRFNSLVSK